MNEGFLSRWSRLKRTGAETDTDIPSPLADEGVPAGGASLAPPPGTDPTLPQEEGAIAEPVDPASLPPVGELGADSDYTRFLSPGVPEELKLLALRKAWSSDPKIAEFRGFAEYDWDCNAPGYGQLLPTDNIKELVDAVFGERPEPPPAEEEAPAEAAIAAADPAESGGENKEDAADPAHREHGGETSGA